MPHVKQFLWGAISLCYLWVVFPKQVQFLKLVLTQAINRLVCIGFVLAHITVPSFSEFCELLPLDLLDVDQLLVLGFFHASHLPGVFNLWQKLHFLLAAFCLEIIQFSMTLLQIIFKHSTCSNLISLYGSGTLTCWIGRLWDLACSKHPLRGAWPYSLSTIQRLFTDYYHTWPN